MNIGFDLDKVFISSPLMVPPYIVERLYKKRDNGILLYRIPSYPEQLFRRLTHLPFLRPPIEKNLKFLRSLQNNQNELYLISSRFKFLESETARVVKRNKLKKVFKKMYFNFDNEQPHEFKDRILSKLKLDVFVDDDLSLLRYVAKKKPEIRFYWLNDKIGGTKISRNIFAITDISDILKK